MKKLFLVLLGLNVVNHACPEESKRKAIARTAVSQAIENREEPGASRRAKSAIDSPRPKGSGKAFYSAQRKDGPALPFNPFPELTVYDVGDGNFIYDDSDVDYVSRREASTPSMTAESAEMMQAESGSGFGPQSLASGAMCLNIVKTGSNTFSLIIANLTLGTEYILTDKLHLVPNIQEQWRPLETFTASATQMTFVGNFVEELSFFRVWDWNAYQGPVVWINTPTAGKTLSGRVQVFAEVEDIFPGRVAELYVDGDLVSAITNGPALFDLDTQQFTNGVHALDVVVRTIPLTTNNLEFASVASTSVTFSNFLSSIDNGPFFSFGAPVLQFSTTGSADYSLEVLNEGGAILKTYQGTTPGGVFQVIWDMTDNGGNSVPREAGYTFRMTATESSGAGGAAAAAAQSQVVIKSFAEGSFYAGYAFLLRNKLKFSSGQFEATEEEQMQRLDQYIFFADLFGPDPAGTRHVLNDQVFVWQSDNQKTTILNSIQRKDVGHVFYTGHGNVDQFGAGVNTIITTSIHANDVKNVLTNNYNVVAGTYAFSNPKRYVEIDGCSTSTGFLPLAFGIPKINTDRRPNIARRSFFGWNNIIEFGWYASRYQKHVDDQNYIWHNPDEAIPIREAIRLAIISGNFEVNLSEIGLYGSRVLTWAVNAP